MIEFAKYCDKNGYLIRKSLYLKREIKIIFDWIFFFENEFKGQNQIREYFEKIKINDRFILIRIKYF